MSDNRDYTPLIEGFRRLRPVIHAWLDRDLSGTPAADPARAYADLTLAFGFARLGAAKDVRACVLAAEVILSTSANEAHAWLLQLFRYRIDEALRGSRHGGLVPTGIGIPSHDEVLRQMAGAINHPLKLEEFTARSLVSISRILDPEECTDPYAHWTKHGDQFAMRLWDLASRTEPTAIEREARALLRDVEAEKPLKRAEVWSHLMRIVRRGDPSLATELAFYVPDLIRTTRPETPSTDWARYARSILYHTLELVARLTDPEPFPPLISSLVACVTDWPQEYRPSVLARLTWPCLRWFRKLDITEEASRFLYETRELWPWIETVADWRELQQQLRGPVTLAKLAHAACQFHAGQPDELEVAIRFAREVAAVAAAAPTTQPVHAARGWTPKDSAEVAVEVARAAAISTPEFAFATIEAWLSTLPQLPNTWTTAAYHSQFHFQIVEGIVLAFPVVGDF